MSLLLSLRSGTRDAHDRLEEGLDVLTLSREPETYVPLLQAFRSLYAPLERALAVSTAAAAVVPDLAARRKTGWLDEDLAALRATPLPDADVPPLTTPEDVAGTCYVLEGATLGGAVLSRSLGDVPHRFFTSYGSRRGAMWSAFRGHLVALDARGVDDERAVVAAGRTFALFEQAAG